VGEESPNRVSTPTGAVFLSYASQDVEAAQRICDALRATGIEVWFDKNEPRGGEAWDRHITRQIKECALFVPVISAHTDGRSEGYFRREWRVAVERMRDMADDQAFLLPVVIDSTGEDVARVPDRFREFQWLRLPGGETAPAAINRIRRLLSPAEPLSTARQAGTHSVREAHGAHGRKKPRWLRPALFGLALAVLGGGYVALNRFVLSKHPTPVTVAIGDKSIAVLPFADLSEKHDQEYFADGMAEEILNILAKVPQLTVIGRTSSFQFKGRTEDLRTIGERLGAAYVVEGSVRKAGPRIRVTTQLLNLA